VPLCLNLLERSEEMRLVLLGPPGAGKGTQAQKLAGQLHLPHISTGDILRQAVKKGSRLGLKANDFMVSGALVPDELVVEMVLERMKMSDARAGFILDGFPRTRPQAQALEKALSAEGLRLDLVIYMETSRDVIVSRLSGRRICRNCGANYHVKNIPPKREGVCDHCGGELYQRDDDKKDTVIKRLEVYEKETADLIEYYRAKSCLRTISGDLDVAQGNKVIKDLFVKEGF